MLTSITYIIKINAEGKCKNLVTQAKFSCWIISIEAKSVKQCTDFKVRKKKLVNKIIFQYNNNKHYNFFSQLM